MKAPTRRTELRRGRDRGVYGAAEIRAILAEGLVCHVAVFLEGGPAVIPTAYALREDELLLHGSTANRVFRALLGDAEACVCVTLLDGLVLARSAFHHSMNYRSVVLYGRARNIDEPGEKREALRALVDHVLPGRSAEVRAPSPEELRRTLVLALPIDEASAKVRSGPPTEEEEDYALDVWAGEIPLRLDASAPTPDPRLRPEIAAPPEIRDYRRRPAG